jgi:hypothetical protein
LIRIPNQKRKTLWKLIRKYVRPGSNLHTDGHKSYWGISRWNRIRPRYKVVKYTKYTMNYTIILKLHTYSYITQFYFFHNTIQSFYSLHWPSLSYLTQKIVPFITQHITKGTESKGRCKDISIYFDKKYNASLQGRTKWRNCRVTTKNPDYQLGCAFLAGNTIFILCSENSPNLTC